MRTGGILAALLSISVGSTTLAAEMCHEADKQDLTPPHAVEMYLDGFHNYQGQDRLPNDKQLQVRVAHYCKQISPDLFQCILYDGTGKNAHLIGVEHVITQRLYDTLPAAEKPYWHGHKGETSSGMLRAPGMSPEKEKATLEFLSHTWGKAWHVWPSGEALPIGEARLIWSIEPESISEKTRRSMAQRETNYSF